MTFSCVLDYDMNCNISATYNPDSYAAHQMLYVVADFNSVSMPLPCSVSARHTWDTLVSVDRHWLTVQQMAMCQPCVTELEVCECDFLLPDDFEGGQLCLRRWFQHAICFHEHCPVCLDTKVK